jgi:hypothetical protein
MTTVSSRHCELLSAVLRGRVLLNKVYMRNESTVPMLTN